MLHKCYKGVTFCYVLLQDVTFCYSSVTFILSLFYLLSIVYSRKSKMLQMLRFFVVISKTIFFG